MEGLPATRAEAQALGLRHYYTGKPCNHGHLAPRFTSIGKCKECSRIAAMRGYVHTSTKRRAYTDQASFVQAATKKHQGRYSYDKAEYVDAHTKLCITCTEHGDFFQSPTNHMQGKGCHICGSARMGLLCRSNTAQFIEQARALWGDRYDYSLVQYTAAHSLVQIICPEHGVFTQTATNHLSKKVACSGCNHMQSAGEEELAKYLAIFTAVNRRDRTIIPPKELDVYLPDQNLAIEYCGMYWHSLGDELAVSEKKNRHQEKYSAAQAKGVRLITLYEEEWKTRKKAIKRLLRNAIGKSKGKLMARKCALSKVPHSEASSFYEKYHPQGGKGHGEHYGLYWKGKLVACMRFTLGANDRGKAAKQRVWTLSRYATRITVAGAASRLFKAFLKDYQPTEVKSFSDNRYFSGEMYNKLGFTLEEETDPDYTIWSPKLGLRPKSHYQRRALPKRLEDHGQNAASFDPKTDPRTELTMTFLMRCRRLYDCGKKRWKWHCA